MINHDQIINDRVVNNILFETYVEEEKIQYLKKYIDNIIENSKSFVGRRVKMVFTQDPFTNLKPGDMGTISHIDDAGTIFASWDCGSGLGLIPGIDSFEIIDESSI